MTAELVLDMRNATGESPVWRADEQALYWTDIPQRQLYRWSATSGQLRHWHTPEQIACLARRTDGLWLAGAQTGVYALCLGDDDSVTSERLVTVHHAELGMRFNDGRCDRQGRLIAGTMQSDMALTSRAGSLYRYDADAGLTVLLRGLITPNGLAFSPDGNTMYLSDSHSSAQKIWAFDYDTRNGTPSAQRLFVDMSALPGRPDGAAVDADGCYWICGNDAGLVHRFTPTGKLDRSLAVPVKKPAMCAFGGPRLDTLYVTSIRPSGIDLSDQPLAGGVFALHPGVCGLPEPMAL